MVSRAVNHYLLAITTQPNIITGILGKAHPFDSSTGWLLKEDFDRAIKVDNVAIHAWCRFKDKTTCIRYK